MSSLFYPKNRVKSFVKPQQLKKKKSSICGHPDVDLAQAFGSGIKKQRREHLWIPKAGSVSLRGLKLPKVGLSIR